MNRILTCVYCGHEYPAGTPPHGNDLLTEHIRVCEKHPMRQAEAKIADLESRLAALQWRPIAEYDAMTEKPTRCFFTDNRLKGMFGTTREDADTHFMQYVPVPEEGE